MTIYYVNPATGSNSNTGLSWAQAWKWLPGNGTAIVAGDEVRIAKSTPITSTDSFTYNGGTYTLPATYLAVTFTSGTAIVSAITGLTGASVGVNMANNTSIPANTKLAYLARTFSITAGFGLVMRMAAGAWSPTGASGEHLKVCLCSDAAGNTPVVTLDAALFNVRAANEASSTVYQNFVYNGGATQNNFSIQSIAIYSGSSAWVQNSGAAATFSFENLVLTTPNQTSVNFVTAGDGILPPTTSPEFVSPVTPVKALNTVTSALNYSLAPSNIGFDSTATATTISFYRTLPITVAEANTLLSFSGTAGNPVKLSGGWNTSSNVQDGYTYMGLKYATTSSGELTALGAFSFASGQGNYLELSRFLCPRYALVRWTDAGASLSRASITLIECQTTELRAPITCTSFTLTSATITRCLIIRQNLVTSEAASLTVTAGTWSFVDGWWPTTTVSSCLVYIQTLLEYTGTAPANAVCTAGSRSISNNSPGTLRLYNVSVVGSVNMYGIHSAAATSGAALVVDTLHLPTYSSSGSITSGITFDGFSTISLKDITASCTQYSFVRVLDGTVYAAPWTASAGGAGSTVTLSGFMKAETAFGLSLYFDRVANLTVPTLVTASGGNPYTSLSILRCRNVTVDAGNYSVLIIDNRTFPDTAQAVSHPYSGVVVQGVTAFFICYGPPAGATLIGCTLLVMDGATAPSPYNGSYYPTGSPRATSQTTFPFSGANTFGCTLRQANGTGNVVINENYQAGSMAGCIVRHLGLTLQGSSLQLSTSSSLRSGALIDMYVEPGVTTTTHSGISASHTWHIRNGVGTYKELTTNSSGHTLVETSVNATYGRHNISTTGSVCIGEVYVPAGKTLEVTIVMSAPSTGNPVKLIFLPSATYVPPIDQMCRMFVSPGTSPWAISANFSPTTSTLVRVILGRVAQSHTVYRYDFTIT